MKLQIIRGLEREFGIWSNELIKNMTIEDGHFIWNGAIASGVPITNTADGLSTESVPRHLFLDIYSMNIDIEEFYVRIFRSCNVNRCCNPIHQRLEYVDNNNVRHVYIPTDLSRRISGSNSYKDSCKSGHLLDDDNVKLTWRATNVTRKSDSPKVQYWRLKRQCKSCERARRSKNPKTINTLDLDTLAQKARDYLDS